jgi:carboxymethylenebutenolidase
MSHKPGPEASGEFFTPETEAKASSVVVLHEWWGITDQIRSVAERLTRAGYNALIPDLFHGATAPYSDAAAATKLMTELDPKAALNEIAGACRLLAEHERSNGKVAVLGFCMGGALALRAAADNRALAAAVTFYGLPDVEATRWSNVRAPILAHLASRDAWAKPERGGQVKALLEASGRSMDLFVYDAEHAFANEARPEVYDEASATLAWERTLEFLGKHLGTAAT